MYIMKGTALESYFTSISGLGHFVKKVKIIPLKVRKVCSSCEATVLFCNFLCTIQSLQGTYFEVLAV